MSTAHLPIRSIADAVGLLARRHADHADALDRLAREHPQLSRSLLDVRVAAHTIAIAYFDILDLVAGAEEPAKFRHRAHDPGPLPSLRDRLERESGRDSRGDDSAEVGGGSSPMPPTALNPFRPPELPDQLKLPGLPKQLPELKPSRTSAVTQADPAYADLLISMLERYDVPYRWHPEDKRYLFLAHAIVRVDTLEVKEVIHDERGTRCFGMSSPIVRRPPITDPGEVDFECATAIWAVTVARSEWAYSGGRSADQISERALRRHENHWSHSRRQQGEEGDGEVGA